MIERPLPSHVDEFIDAISFHQDVIYAQYVLLLYRTSAHHHMVFFDHPWITKPKLFCTYEGKRYVVASASRLGCIFLHSNLKHCDINYELSAAPNKCSEWSPTP